MGALHDPPARATHLAVSAPSTQSEVLRMRVYGPSREQPPLSRHRTAHQKQKSCWPFSTQLCVAETPCNGLIMLDPKKDSCVHEQWMWNEGGGGGGGEEEQNQTLGGGHLGAL